MFKKPAFKPGKSAALKFGNEILNGNVNWRNSLLELLLYSDYTLDHIMTALSCSQEALLLIINYSDASLLDFKQGARLLMMHDKVKPECVEQCVCKCHPALTAAEEHETE